MYCRRLEEKSSLFAVLWFNEKCSKKAFEEEEDFYSGSLSKTFSQLSDWEVTKSDFIVKTNHDFVRERQGRLKFDVTTFEGVCWVHRRLDCKMCTQKSKPAGTVMRKL